MSTNWSRPITRVGTLLSILIVGTTLGCGKASVVSHDSSLDTGVGSDAGADAGDAAGQSTLPRTGREWVDQQDLIIMPWAYLLEDSVVETATIEAERLVFPDDVSPELAEHDSLDILISAHPDLPFLRRITEVEHTDDQIIFETEGAALTDVLYKASFTTGEPASAPADAEESRTLQHYLKEELETKNYGGGTISVESGMNAKPVFEVTPSLHFSIKIEPGADEKTPKSFNQDYFKGTTQCQSHGDCFFTLGHTKERISRSAVVFEHYQSEWASASYRTEACCQGQCCVPYVENWGGLSEILVRKGWCWAYRNYCDNGSIGPRTYEVKADRPSQQPPDMSPCARCDKQSFDNETIDYGYYESLRSCDDIIVSLAAEREDGLLHEASECKAYRRNFYQNPYGYSRVTQKCDPDWFGGALLAPLPAQADWAKEHCSGQLKELEFDASLKMTAGLEDVGFTFAEGADWTKKWTLPDSMKDALELRTRFLVGWLPVVLTFQFDLRVEAEAQAAAAFDANLLKKLLYDGTFDVGFHYYAGAQYKGDYHNPGEELGKFHPNKETPGGFVIEPANSAWDAKFNATVALIPELTVYLYDLVGPYIRPLSLYAQLDAATGSDSGYDCTVGVQAGVTGEIGIKSAAKIPFCSSCSEFGPWPLYEDTCGVKDSTGDMMCVGGSSTISRSTECSTGEAGSYMNKSYCADKSWCTEKCLVGNSDNCEVLFRAQDIKSVQLTVKDADDPVGKNDRDGFIELDSIWISSQGSAEPNNPARVYLDDMIVLDGSDSPLGKDDPTMQCAGSDTSQGDWETGGEIFAEKLVVTFERPIEPGDTLHFLRTIGDCMASGTAYVQIGNQDIGRWGPKMIPDTWSQDKPSVSIKEDGCPTDNPDRAQGDICIR